MSAIDLMFAEIDRMRRGLRAADTELGHAMGERDAARAELEKVAADRDDWRQSCRKAHDSEYAARAELERVTGVAKALRITVAEMLSGKQHTPARTAVWQSTLKHATEVLTTPGADATPDESVCQRCGGPNVTPWAAPSPLWNEVMRGGDINAADRYGFCCPTCFVALADEAGIADDWQLSARRVHRELTTVTPSGRVWDDRAWLWVEPAPTADVTPAALGGTVHARVDADDIANNGTVWVQEEWANGTVQLGDQIVVDTGSDSLPAKVIELRPGHGMFRVEVCTEFCPRCWGFNTSQRCHVNPETCGLHVDHLGDCLLTRCADATPDEPAPGDTAPPEVPEPHGWTDHGHQCCGAHVYRAGRPALVARCGGPGLCTQCSRDAAQIHARPAQDGGAR